MEIATVRAPGVWSVLLWKDFQQIKTVLLAIILGVLVPQVLVVAVSELIVPDSAGNLYDFMCSFTLVSPVLAVLGCAGMLVGHERQMRTWDWSSSLPVSWGQSLASKIIVTLSGCLGLLLPLGVIPVVLIVTGAYQPNEISATTSLYAIPIVILFVVEVVVVFFLATLLTRGGETLSAMVAACFALMFAHVLLSVLGAAFWNSLVEYFDGGDRADFWIAFLQLFAVTSAASVAMVLVFRWRWGVGQKTAIFARRSTLQQSHTIAVPRARFFYGRAPSEWSMQRQLSWRNSMTMRISIFVGVFLLSLWIGAMERGEVVPGILFLCGFGTVLFGVTAFEGDRAGGRSQFLSDRGVNPKTLMWSRLIPPAILSTAMTGVCVAAGIAMDSRSISTLGTMPVWDISVLLFVTTITFLPALLAGALSSLCFKNATVSGVVAITTVGAAAIVFALVASASEGMDISRTVGPPWLLFHTAVWSIATPLILFAAIRRLVPQWVVQRDARLHRHYWWVVSLAIVFPVFMAVTFGFLGTPRVEWKGAPVAELQIEKLMLPNLDIGEELLDGIEVDSILPVSYHGITGLDETVAKIEGGMKSLGGSGSTLSGTELLTERVERLEASLQGEEIVVGARHEYQRTLGRLIRETALLAAFAVRMGDRELYGLCVRCNKLLQETGDESVWSATERDRSRYWWILNGLSDRELAWSGIREDLLPDSRRDALMSKAISAKSATYLREFLRGNKVPSGSELAYTSIPSGTQGLRILGKFYPPIRWRAERDLAQRLVEGEVWISNSYVASAPEAEVRLRISRRADVRLDARAPEVEGSISGDLE